MAYQFHRTGHHVVIRWEQTPTAASAKQLHRDVDAAFKAAGAPLVCFIVIPTDNVDIPGPEARQVLQTRQQEIFDRTASIDMVLVGSSIGASLIRTTLRAMSLVTRAGDRVSIHSGPEEALKGRNVPSSVAAALRGASTV